MATTTPEDANRRRDGAGAPDEMPGRRLPRVVRRFLDTEAAGGVVLLVATVVALRARAAIT